MYSQNNDLICPPGLSTSNRDNDAVGLNLLANLVAFAVMVFVAEVLIAKANMKVPRDLHRKTGWVEFIYRERPNNLPTAETAPSDEHHSHNLSGNGPIYCDLEESDLEKENSVMPEKLQGTQVATFPVRSDKDVLNSNLESTSEASSGKITSKPSTSIWTNKSKISSDPGLLEKLDLSTSDFNTLSSEMDPMPMEDARRLQECLLLDTENSTKSSNQESQVVVDDYFSDFHPLPFRSVFELEDEHIRSRRGEDAIKYLNFLRHLIKFFAFLSILTICVILPVNFLGDALPVDKRTLVARTTIRNIHPESKFFLVHIICSGLVLLMAVRIFFLYASTTHFDPIKTASRTLMVRSPSKTQSTRQSIANHLSNIIGGDYIEGIQFVYDCREIFRLKDDFVTYYKAWKYCRDYLLTYSESFELRPFFFGQWLGLIGLCRCFPKTHGFTYYSRLKWATAKSLLQHHTRALRKPKSSFFVTFASEHFAAKVYQNFKSNFFMKQLKHLKLASTLSKSKASEFNDEDWTATFAPNPGDIDWSALITDTRWIWIRRFLMNLLLFIIFLFCTTPFILTPYLQALQGLMGEMGFNQTFNHTQTLFMKQIDVSTIYESIRTFCFVIMAQILPVLVTLFSSHVPHYIKSEQSNAIIWRVYIFLLLMIIIIPSLGVSSLHELIRSIMDDERFTWYCMFQPYEFSFYLVYVVQSAFIGNGMKLLRVSKIITYFFFMYLWAPGSAEFETARKRVSFDFSLGHEYPSLLFMFTMICLYSISCPLIVPCGLIFMICKYYVDRYNIYHAMETNKITFKIHKHAMVTLYFAIFMMQFHIFTFIYTQRVQQVVVVMNTFVLLASIGYLVLLISSNQLYGVREEPATTEKKNWCSCNYIPSIFALLDLYKLGTDKNSTTQTAQDFTLTC